MGDKFERIGFHRVFQVEKLVTLFYMELPKDFAFPGESHDFWEMVYIDKGEMICTAENKRFTVKSGELVFHKPNEYHNLGGNNAVAANISVLTFQCRSKAMKEFENKIFRLNAEEKALLSSLFTEGMSCYRLSDPTSPLLPSMQAVSPEPFGGSQMIKNLLEIFLIRLCRNQDSIPKTLRQNILIDGVDVPYPVREILDYLHSHIYARITVSDVARAVGKGESTVKQLFSLYRKNGIMKYYNGLKIKEARRLIRESKYNMTQIADMLCFDSPQYFSKCFRDYTKMTPSEYKRSIVK